MSATSAARSSDTWWQTETAAIPDHPDPGATPLKPGRRRGRFRVEPVIVDGEGKRLDGVAEGNLCLARAWPGIMRTVFGDHKRFSKPYFSAYPGLYFTGDGATPRRRRLLWITGRVAT